MKVYINDTQKIENLTIINKETGVEWTADLINAYDFWNEDNERYEMTQNEYDWWCEYITNYENDEEEIESLASELKENGIDSSVLYDALYKEFNGAVWDHDQHHDVKQNVVSDIRKKYLNDK